MERRCPAVPIASHLHAVSDERQIIDTPLTGTAKIMKTLPWFVLLVMCTAAGQERVPLSGRVVDRAMRNPIPAAIVVLKDTSLGLCANSDGYFQFQPLPPGSYTAHVSAIGFEPRDYTVTLRSGSNAALLFELRETVYQLNPVTVSSTRERSLVSEVPSSVEVISSRDIERRNLQNVSEAVAALPGVSLKEYGGIGDSKSLSIRGSTAGQVLVLIDGQRLNTAQTGEVDLSTIPIEGVERVEIVKGGTSALYGADAVGGVINIITKSRPYQPTAGITAGIMQGSFGTSAYKGGGTYATERIFTLLSYKYLHTDGNYYYDSPYGGRIKRDNADLSSHSIFGKSSIQLGVDSLNKTLSMSGQLYLDKGGSPGTTYQPYTDARKKNQNKSANISYDQRVGSIYNTLHVGGYYHNFESWYDSPSAFVPVHSYHHSIAWGTELQGRAVFSASNVSTGGYEFRRDDLSSTTVNTKPHRTTNSVYLQHEWEPFVFIRMFFRRLLAIPALRWDQFSDFGGRLSPKIGIVGTTGDGWQGSLKANYGRSFRAPSFNDLYWPKDPWTLGNPNLKPESGRDFDIGTMMRSAFLWSSAVDVTYFRNDVTDLVLWQQGSNSIWTPDNVGKALLQGIEAKISVSPLNGPVRLEWNYTFLDAVDKTDPAKTSGTVLPYRPKHTHNFSIAFDYEPVFLQLSATYMSRRFTTSANTISLPSNIAADFLAAYKIFLTASTIDVRFEVKNIFDEKYQVMDGFPMPTREVRVSADFSLSNLLQSTQSTEEHNGFN